jgi:hypothetical protein
LEDVSISPRALLPVFVIPISWKGSSTLSPVFCNSFPSVFNGEGRVWIAGKTTGLVAAGEAETVGASEDTVDGEGLEFRTPKGEVSLDTVKSSEPVKLKVIGEAPSKLKESARDDISVLDKLELTCVVFITRHTPFSEN